MTPEKYQRAQTILEDAHYGLSEIADGHFGLTPEARDALTDARQAVAHLGGLLANHPINPAKPTEP